MAAPAERREPIAAPGRLWSLWEIMIKFDVRLLVVRLNHLERFEKELRGHMPLEDRPSEPQMKALGHPMWTSDHPDAFATAAGRNVIWAHLGPMIDEMKPLGFVAAPLEIQHIWNHADRWTRQQLADGFATLRWKVEQELNQKFFLFLDESEAQLFDEKLPFGESAAKAFPSAEMDISEATKCLALGRYNAVIYHLMMAAEFGLRALAADRRVVVTNRNGNNMPLEFAQWGEILGELQKEIAKIKNWPASHARAEAQQFYNDAMLSAQSFNDGYRTHMAHGRSKLRENDETLALYGHVRRFLMKLSEKITETTTMPEIWP